MKTLYFFVALIVVSAFTFNNASIQTDKANCNEYRQEAITQTWPANYHISRDGKLIGIIHFVYHHTVNANGVWTSYHGEVFEYNYVGEGKIK